MRGLQSKERAVLGTLLGEWPARVPDAVQELLRCAPDSFDDLRLGCVAVSARELQLTGTAINVVSVSRHLDGRKKLDEIGGDDFVRTLILESLPLETAAEDAGELLRAYQVRRKRSVVLEAAEAIQRMPDKAHLIADGVVSALTELKRETNGHRLSVRRPSEILAMQFADDDVILGDRVLAKGQFLTVLGPGGLGKSRLALQLAVCCATGRPFPGLATYGRGLKWLFLQAENSNRRLQIDLAALKHFAGREWEEADRCMSIHTIENDSDGFLCLSNPATQSAIAGLIEETAPDVVVFDPLKDFGIGDLNSDADMTATCQTVARLTRKGNPERAGVVLHHSLTGKSGASRAVGYDRASYGRNSKILQSWTRAQINVAPGTPDSNEVLVISCGKCSNGIEFPAYALKLNRETLIYEIDPHFDLAAWGSETSGHKQAVAVSNDLVAKVCNGALSKKDLVAAIKAETGCEKTAAYSAVERATKAKRIQRHPVHGTYSRR